MAADVDHEEFNFIESRVKRLHTIDRIKSGKRNRRYSYKLDTISSRQSETESVLSNTSKENTIDMSTVEVRSRRVDTVQTSEMYAQQMTRNN